METKNLINEHAQLNKILQSYNNNSLKETLFLANYSKSLYPKLNNIPFFPLFKNSFGPLGQSLEIM